MNIFLGVVIIPGVFLLHKVRKKDWTKHWQEMEAEHKARLELRPGKRALPKRPGRQPAMKNNHGTIILASASPRRTELMALAGIEFSVVPADICEDVLPG